MNHSEIYRLPRLSVIDVTGADAATIVNNVTTNQVRALMSGQGSECFVTDVRGKTLGHVGVYRVGDSIRLVGAAGQSGRVAEHIDRYTIREDATPSVRDAEFMGLVCSPDVTASLSGGLEDGVLLQRVQLTVAGESIDLYSCRWLGDHTGVILLDAQQADAVIRELTGRTGTIVGDEAAFHRRRIAARFPWFGIDLDESNLPQEADRDAVAISFTKGCYLGQETVARLDALGQVQKKLVAWSIEGGKPERGTVLQSRDKTVGRLTSVAQSNEGPTIALGMARRSHFEPGSKATGSTETGETEMTATVLP